MTDTPIPKAKIEKNKRISFIWLLPLTVLAIGIGIIWKNYQEIGPTITLHFSTAEGLHEGKTKIKARSVELGVVEEISLSADYQSTIVTARLHKKALPLLREDTSFWVVKPRIGANGISGIGTVISGAYIELDPGKGVEGRREFKGLENVPLTRSNEDGTQIVLSSKENKSLNAGDPVTYKGFRVGRIISSRFDVTHNIFKYTAFILAPYDKQLTTSSRFWNAGGLTIKSNTQGISIHTASLESLLSGGIAFDLPKGFKSGDPVEDGHLFKLYPDKDSMMEEPYKHFAEYILLIETSVRGLEIGAPVEYRGIRIGSVSDISFQYLHDETPMDPKGIPIPVIIRIDPARFEMKDDEQAKEQLQQGLETGIKLGLRARLETGNLLTGNLYVSLDYYNDQEEFSMIQWGDYWVFPTIPHSIAQLKQKIFDVLDKVKKLPLDDALQSFNNAMDNTSSAFASIKTMTEKLDQVLSQDQIKTLPIELQGTLKELQNTLKGLSPGSVLQEEIGFTLKQIQEAMRGVEELTDSIKTKPNSLIFPSRRKQDPQPKGSE